MIKQLVSPIGKALHWLMFVAFTAALGLVVVLRWQAGLVLQLQLSGLELVALFLVNLAYFGGIYAIYLLLTKAFRRHFFIRFIIFWLLIILLLFEGLGHVFAKAVGNGVDAFGLYYLLTQFNLLHSDFYSYLNGMLIFAAIYFTLIVLAVLRFYQAKQTKQIVTLLLCLLATNVSLLSLYTPWPKSLTVNTIPYLLATLSSKPSPEDFLRASPLIREKHASMELADAKQLNVVVIILESTRADALSIYNPALKRKNTFFEEIAQQSIVFDNAYAVLPFTVKSMVAMNCGVSPYLNFPILESIYGIPKSCLAHELAENGYQTRFAQSSTRYFGNKRSLTRQLGYVDFVGAEDYEQEGFAVIEPLGFEDSIMLASNEQWLQAVEQPFFVSYLTLGPHWPYTSYSESDYIDYIDQDDYLHDLGKQYNHYLNAVYAQDKFVEKLLEQFKQKGLYESTVFIFVADHGQGFGEHKHFQHANNLYQEGVHVPLLIHAPALIKHGQRVDELISHTDIPQIIKNLLQGQELLHSVANEKVFSACWYWKWCAARTDKTFKYIYNFDGGAEELYNLSVDPKEQSNIALQHPEQVKQYRKETLDWYYQQLAFYGGLYSQFNPQFYLLGHPKEPTP